MNFVKILLKFQKIGYSDIIPFVSVGNEEVHKNMQCKVSYDCQNGCHLKTISQSH